MRTGMLLFLLSFSSRPLVLSSYLSFSLVISMDIYAAVIGMVLLLEATRRALGPPLMIVACLFLVYIFAGPLMPEVVSHRGASLSKAASHMWITTEGVFGIALGVSTSFVFLFVLFGAL